MKKFTILVFMLFSIGILSSFGQTTIWTEDFNDPADDGVGATGPIPVGTNTGVTAPVSGKWTVDVTNCNLSATTDWYRVQNSLLEARDVDGTQQAGGTGDGALWTSESISISGYSNVSISVDFSKSGTLEDLDFIKASYQIDGGTITQFAFFNDDFVDQTVSVAGLSGTTLVVYLEADNNAGTEYHRFDNVLVEGVAAGGVSNPTNFAATTAGTDQIDLSWTKNANNDDVMVAWSSDGIFGTPSGTYIVGDPITGGGTVLYNGAGTSTSHTGLTADTRYYYKAWSVDATPTYSSGVTDDTTTLATEPAADPTLFAATTNSASEITVSWTDAAGAASYLIKGSSVGYGDIVAPTDGSTEANSQLVQNVATGVQAHQFIGLAPNTTYYFQIYPYNGDNGSVNYKTNSPQQTSATTDAANTDLIISEVADPKDVYQARFVELYNLSASTIDFDLEDWYLSRQTNGGATWEDKKLTGSIVAGGKYVAANNNGDVTDFFNVNYGFMADYDFGGTSGNGDDGYYLYYGGDHTTGTLIDAFGVINVDGSGQAWEYTDTKAVRLRSVTAPDTSWTAAEWDIPGLANVADMTPSAHKEDVVWQGAGTNIDDWNEKGGNWPGTYGYIPDASFNVSIPYTMAGCVIYSEAACYDLTLNSDALLDVSPAVPLTVYGNLSIAAVKSRAQAMLTVQGDAIGNGSVIVDGAVSGAATVQRYFTGYDVAPNGWHNIGSPVNNMLIAGSSFDPASTLNDLYQWDEPSSIWQNYKQGHFTNFTNGKGYLCAFQTSGTKDFVGTLNTADVAWSALSFVADGWHLLGNPFPSAITWNSPSADWSLTNIGAVAKIWNEPAGNYSDISAGGIIPSTNGYFVQVSNATNGLTIPASARVHNSANNYKSSRVETEDETLIIRITNDENTYYDVNRVGFRAEASEAWDIAFDSHKLFGSATAPQIWTVSNEEIFSKNYLPYVYTSYELPLHFRAGANTAHHLIFEGVDSFYPNSEIYLEDLFLEKTIDLRAQQLYDFIASTTDDEGRFILHFYGITSTGEKPVINKTTVYAYQNTVYVKSGSLPKEAAGVEVFNVMGQLVFAGQLEPSTLCSFKLNEKAGVYVVRVHSNKQTIVQKVMIR
ncbi:MAG: lamin tail domain-containing protein [Bacteroidales bacterium]|nr:lamin tail domain-containing protein [Bacteroidales bacterium]